MWSNAKSEIKFKCRMRGRTEGGRFAKIQIEIKSSDKNGNKTEINKNMIK